ncbi:DUF4031 domain-containing protein [Aquipseudomonas alcaligenes]|uniref:DUF4031 domain-containing protein n=1 Tax=Aquipseudomonas alcaligenes TaxID=43263 RepID=UPI00292D24DF|nr:DUF4031 domain-containing protein [Pseudomonas alcaligenes]
MRNPRFCAAAALSLCVIMCILNAHFARTSHAMPVYVDSEEVRWKGRSWCHLVADTLDELHHFAAQLGLQRKWFQSKSFYPHYDVTLSVRARAIQLGAIDADRKTIIGCCKQMRAEMLAQRTQQQSLLLEPGGIHGTCSQAASRASFPTRILP